MAFKFEELRVWKKSVELTTLVDRIADKFPQKEIFNLSSQIRRAADSISLNIAEGSTGQSTPEFKRFLGMSLRSGIEVIGCLYLAKERDHFRRGLSRGLYFVRTTHNFYSITEKKS